MNVSCYATPAESTAGRFQTINRKKFGVIPNVTEREYMTNSYHIPVWFNITAKKKIDLEAPFHELCNGGHISYVELNGNARNNTDAIHSIVDYAMDKNMGYFSMNLSLDRCPRCGYEGIIGNECPKCFAKDETEVHIRRLRRCTGYLTGDYQVRFNPYKQAEVRDRVKHM
jgi:ribonucleoside-triphosphate reductase